MGGVASIEQQAGGQEIGEVVRFEMGSETFPRMAQSNSTPAASDRTTWKC